METINLIQLQDETIDCNIRLFNKYYKKHYTLKKINDFMINAASQKDASLYFPISAYIHHNGHIYIAFITHPIKITI